MQKFELLNFRITRPQTVAILTLVILVGGLILWQGGLKHWVIPRGWGVVEPGQIYRSGQLSRFMVEEVLQEHQIGMIVFMSGDNLRRPDVVAEREAAKKMGIERINLNLNGNGTGDWRRYVAAVAAMKRAGDAGKAVLVHCHTGAQRTGGTIALYRVLVQGRSGREAYNELRSYAHDPADNPKMIPFLNRHMAEIAQGLVDAGVIQQPPEELPLIGP